MTQAELVLEVLKRANGQWVNGQYFLRTMMLSQYHARISELKSNKGGRFKYSGVIQGSSFRDEYGFMSYRLVPNETISSGNVINNSSVVNLINSIPPRREIENEPIKTDRLL